MDTNNGIQKDVDFLKQMRHCATTAFERRDSSQLDYLTKMIDDWVDELENIHKKKIEMRETILRRVMGYGMGLNRELNESEYESMPHRELFLSSMSEYAMQFYLSEFNGKMTDTMRHIYFESLFPISYLKQLRMYFGQHDKTPFEHGAYNFFDGLIKELKQNPGVCQLDEQQCREQHCDKSKCEFYERTQSN